MRSLALPRAVVVVILVCATAIGAQEPAPATGERPLVLVGGRSYAPLSYLEDGQPRGIKIDLAREMSAVLGRAIRIELTDWETARARVLSGHADAILTMSPTAERLPLYDFTEPTMTHEWGLFVRRGEGHIWDVADLEGRTVGVTAASLPRPFLEARTTARLVTIDSLDEGFARVAEGTLDAIAADLWVGAYTIERRGLRNIVRTGPPFATSTSAFAVRKGNDALLADLNRAIRAVKANGTLDRILVRWRPKEMVFLSRARMLWILAVITATLLALGVFGILAVWKQLRAQAGRERAEERYRQVVHNAHDLIFTVDAGGYCLSMNRAGQEVTGFVADDPRGVALTRLVVPEHTAIARDQLRRVLAGESVPRFELDIVSREGKRLTLELDVHPIRERGLIVGVQGIARDMTARKELEARFLQAQKMEAIGRLAGGVAHDFNNILTVIMGCAELAEQQLEAGHGVRSDLAEIRRAAGSAAALTRQLLIFSRKSIAQPAVIDLTEAVKGLNKMLRRLVGEDVDCVVRLSPGPALVTADATQIEQVIMNLVVNARDAMPGGGTLTIATSVIKVDEAFAARHQLATAGEYVRLAVSDTGVGMAPDVQARVFEPFFTTKGSGKGTGLGLPTVHEIARHGGGCVTVESAPGLGATFTVYLPRTAAAASSASVVIHPAAAPARPATILFVEDDDAIRAIGARALRQSGYTVLTARHAADAIAVAGLPGFEVDLLLTDVVMPGLNGRQLAERLRRKHPGLPVLYTSGYTDDLHVLQELQREADFIQKPYAPDTLAREVARVLARSYVRARVAS
jgi:PAS domain S-box-containing protein